MSRLEGPLACPPRTIFATIANPTRTPDPSDNCARAFVAEALFPVSYVIVTTFN